MSEPSKKSSAKIIALAAVLAIAASAFFGVSWWEKEQVRRVEETLKTVSGNAASVKIGFLDKSVAITGLKINKSFPGEITLVMDVEHVTVSGVNSDALSTKGVVPLADSVAMSGVTLAFTGPPSSPDTSENILKQELSFKSVALTGLRGDFAGLIAELERGKGIAAQISDPQTLFRFISIAKGFRAASASITGYEVHQNLELSALPWPAVTSIESMQGKDVGLLDFGPSSCKNWNFSVADQIAMRIETMTLQRMSIPDIFTSLAAGLTDGQGAEHADAALAQSVLQTLAKEPLVIQGCVIGNASLRIMTSESISLKNFNLDLEFGAEKLALKHSLDELLIPPSYYRNSDEIGTLLAQVYGKPLNFSARADLRGSQQNGRVELRNDIALTEKEFGSVKVNADLIASAPGADSLETLLQSSPDWLLKKARFAIEDRKLLETAFVMQHEMLKQSGIKGLFKSAADMRANTALQLQQWAAANPNPDVKAVLEGVARLARQSGILVISLNPDRPQFLVNVFDMLMGEGVPGDLRAAAEYTPAEVNTQGR